MNRRSASWNLADVLDFESLLAADAALPEDRLRERDHALYTGKIAPQLPATVSPDRRQVFRAWLEHRRHNPGTLLPGEAFETGWQTIVTVAVAAGLLLGISLTAGLLHYSGEEPINVMLFLGCILGPQWLFLLGGLLLWVERRTTRFLTRWRPLQAALAALTTLLSAGLRKLPGEQRDTVRAALGGFGPRAEQYRPLATWRLLQLTQLFAVCFNIAVLGTVLAELPARELRFGWQTTLSVEPAQVANVVSSLATPWEAWAPHPRPTAEQVIATRYAPGQSHRDLPGDAMRAWWPFLCYAVATYGLGVRLLLLIVGVWNTRAALRRIRFDHADANALWRRLTGPRITVRGGEARLPQGRLAAPEPSRSNAPFGRTVFPEATVSDVPSATSGTPPLEVGPQAPTASPVPTKKAPEDACLLILAEELALNLAETQARTLMNERYGWQLKGLHPAKIDNRGASAEVFEAVRGAAPSLLAVVVITPASRDPIVAVALFLREVISAAAGKPEVIVHLLGASQDGSFAPVDDARFEIWRRFRDIQKLRIGLER